MALWAWDIVVDNCAICRNHIMDLCIECQANQASVTSEECTVAWGKWIIHFIMLDLGPNVLKPFLKRLWNSAKFYRLLQHSQIGKYFFLPKTARYQRWDHFLRETELVISVCIQLFSCKPVEHTNGKYAMGVELVKLFKWGKFLF